ncbi:phage scaffolding protein [Cytobacillus kochii]|uniref:phage scaffolding protein n=1 Tax=Cytobacillus kochii TaxID=859143 RepID=UPI00203BAA0D|nr:phage scaffolding protein [Cytobacillus kochii]MCM3324246.1 phage scaffolding protein [Cytobacillus kochii]MCM3346685.1 phage scaffolding protein [Cytobacillus kochii]
MDIQELLGEELYKQVMEKAGENKLAVVSDGNWIPKDKFNDKLEDIKNLKEQITSRDDQLEELKKVDAEALQQKIQELQEENNNTKTEYEDKLQKQTFDYALKDALTDAKVRNPKAAKALLDLESIKLDGDKLLGLDTQLNTIKESDPYLFETEQKPNSPTIVAPGNPQSGTGGVNPFSKESWNLTEQGKLYKENPDLYNALKAQAGK